MPKVVPGPNEDRLEQQGIMQEETAAAPVVEVSAAE